MRNALSLLVARVREGARLMVGMPDYQAYVSHRQTEHPGDAVMTYPEFFKNRQDCRYATGKGKGVSRCC